MTKEELVRRLSKKLLVKTESSEYESLNSLICIQNYLLHMTKEELLGVATQQGIKDFY